MSIVLARVDDRLIHGQVATSWIRSNAIEVAVVVDDKIGNDDQQKSILKMSAPASTKVYAMGVDKFLDKYNKGILDKYRVMLVFENVFAPLELIKKGLMIKTLNLGGIRFKEGRTTYTKSVSLTDEEKKCILDLNSLGVHVFSQQVLADEPIDIISLIK
ncbi:MAG: PTS sugar transporter subunit IIB [Erysipelotrichaceae bacterium]|nr:PTS sugar transporter subunit IIB [Erysipelotrichaceae bacterium]MDY5251614.1 PTS sugar transporter subunit IIB [Erysipelotrichaceae bacterium]